VRMFYPLEYQWFFLNILVILSAKYTISSFLYSLSI
jgi:hypothetical protein